MKHPDHTYGGFIPAILERGMTDMIKEMIRVHHTLVRVFHTILRWVPVGVPCTILMYNR
jgi:hypothetical protein